jgi:hypothetical protein
MTREINIPFGGFYESMWSSILDDALEQAAEYDCNERQREEGVPSDLHLDERAYQDAIFEACNYRAGELEIAKDYVECFNRKIKEETGIDLGLKFKTMESPREYNFTTDRLFSDISLKARRRMLAYSRNLDNHATLARMIEKRHTSRSGFSSFYSNDWADWKAKPVAEWDHNELGTLLCVLVARLGQDWEWDIYESLAERGYDYQDEAIDWAKYEATIKEAREDLEVELRSADPDYIAPAYRCPKTIDMFAPK